LQRTGLSQAKVRYARALARALDRSELDLAGLARLSDDEAQLRLQAVPGVGAWSAQIYLMFSLGRPDLWPRSDIGLLRGLQRIDRLPTRPTPEEGERIAQRFSPHRSAIALLAWKQAALPVLAVTATMAQVAKSDTAAPLREGRRKPK
jgi:DNA-3-methyladenine glycosylase II